MSRLSWSSNLPTVKEARQRVKHTGNEAQDGQQDVDEEIRTASAL